MAYLLFLEFWQAGYKVSYSTYYNLTKSLWYWISFINILYIIRTQDWRKLTCFIRHETLWFVGVKSSGIFLDNVIIPILQYRNKVGLQQLAVTKTFSHSKKWTVKLFWISWENTSINRDRYNLNERKQLNKFNYSWNIGSSTSLKKPHFAKLISSRSIG